MKIYQGTAASNGIAIGNACIIEHKDTPSIPRLEVSLDEKIPGWKRFEKSLETITDYYKNLIDSSNKEQEEVIQTYLLMLSDTEFISQIKALYDKNNFNIEYCIKVKVEESTSQLRSIGDDYLSERAKDIEDVFEKVLFNMLGFKQVGMDNVTSESIVVAENITPSEAMSLFKKNIKGIILEEGGISSHISILARTYGVPLIFGIENPCTLIQNNKLVIIDTRKSLVIVEPDKAIHADYITKLAKAEEEQKILDSFIEKKGLTKDGTEITIYANISSLDDAKIALAEGADGIGLFRTEFLFMDREDANKSSTEEAQFKVYSEILKIMGDKTVTIRTLDCGGDKITNFNDSQSAEEKNPLLGCRAIRFCLKRKDIFKTQLRALYRASVYGNLRILLPMITSISQVEEVKKIINEIKSELKREVIEFNENVPVGVMIETPAAAIMSDVFAQKCDFLSIGSNDLTQYILAVDRENNTVSDLYDETHPAVLRVIKEIIFCAKQNNLPLSVCGEMASREETMRLLIGLGVRQLSVSPKSISITKQILSKTSIEEVQNLVEDIGWCKK
ncbi:MAG: phosphoenolpyruvate--protein phosphotransferase [Treponemataceae bacterium]|nr:phosphoenolpyruvate--protein phosphotransferase [Treponemataceae bacterium]